MSNPRKVVHSFRAPEGRYKEDALFSMDAHRMVSRIEASNISVPIEYRKNHIDNNNNNNDNNNNHHKSPRIEESRLFFRNLEKIHIVDISTTLQPTQGERNSEIRHSPESDSDSDSETKYLKHLKSHESIHSPNDRTTCQSTGVFIEDLSYDTNNSSTSTTSTSARKKTVKNKVSSTPKQSQQTRTNDSFQQEQQKYIKIIIGFRSGEIWLGNVTKQNVLRLNTKKEVTSSPVICADWVSNLIDSGGTLFFTIHSDGYLYFYDEKRGEECLEFPSSSSSCSSSPRTLPPSPSTSTSSSGLQYQKDSKSNTIQTGKNMLLSKVQKKKFESQILVEKQQNYNPCSRWLIGRNGVTSALFSPQNSQIFATIDEDGVLRVIDYKQEKIIVSFKSFYGSLLCLSWSPDGKYIVTGGQDDLITIYNWQEEKVVARCVGHESWVTSIKFDPIFNVNEIYRFVSVGQDTQLCIWDFSVENIPPPLLKAQYSSGKLEMKNRYGDDVILPPKKDEVPTLQPVSTAAIHSYPIFGLVITNDYLMTCSNFDVKLWSRPCSRRFSN